MDGDDADGKDDYDNGKGKDDGKQRNRGGGGDAAAPVEVAQDNEQDAESGDVDQTFTVTGGGDNSNQCVGIQGNSNTGNAQNELSLTQFRSEADEFEFDEVRSDLTVGGTSTTTCDQQANQAATASG